MNNHILKPVIQDFINKYLDADTVSLLFKKFTFENVTIKEIVTQIEAKKRCKNKLPSWYATKNIYYPDKLNIEQTSSEITAKYKTEIINGNELIDLTGGLGVDSYYFSKVFDQVTHCEINQELSAIAALNFKSLQAPNITTVNASGINYLNEVEKSYDWIYVDPSRRHDLKGKVFYLKDCEPNIPKYLDQLFEHSSNILIKTSPMLDIHSGINELEQVKEVHVVAVNNEVKEVLFLLERGNEDPILIKTINILKDRSQQFDFMYGDEQNASAEIEPISNFLYEPNAAILKAGAFKSIAHEFSVKKLHFNTHLYTSEILNSFPGRRFRINKVVPYHKKTLRSLLKGQKMNVATRNFPESVASLKKLHGFKDGGNMYLFFTTNNEHKKVVIFCEKV